MRRTRDARSGILGNRNYLRYLGGQGISMSGLWMQQSAELWLVLTLTNSPLALGVHSLLRYGPIFFGGAYGGLIADRFDRRRLLLVTQSMHAFAVLTLAALILWTDPTITTILALVLLQGLVNAIDNPLRRAFIRDLVPDEQLPRAIGLNSTVMAVAQVVGPGLAGLIIVTGGVAACFLYNGVTYFLVLLVLWRIDRRTLRAPARVARGPGQLREGLRYTARHREIRTTLTMVLLVSMFSWNFPVILPVYATEALRGDATLFGALQASASIGSLAGAIALSTRRTVSFRVVLVSLLVTTGSLVALAVAPGAIVAFIAMVVLGGSHIVFNISSQTRIQLAVDPSMQGRVLGLHSVGTLGSRMLGGAVAGLAMQIWGPRGAFLVGAVVVLATTTTAGGWQATASWVESRRAAQRRARENPATDEWRHDYMEDDSR